MQTAARGVPTVQPIAIGETVRGLLPGNSYLITLALDNVEPLDRFLQDTFDRLEPLRQTRLRRQLNRALAQFLARVHDAGLNHHDLHAGNILLRLEAAGPQLFLIDLHAVSIGGPLSWAQGRDNLILLNHWFIIQANRTDRLRFWKSYWEARQQLDDPLPWALLRVLAGDMELRTWRSNLELWRQRDQRCLGRNRQFGRVHSAQVVGHALTELDPNTIEPFLRDPDAPFGGPAVRLLKDSRTSTVGEFEMVINGLKRRVIYKRFRVTTWHHPLASLFRPAPALRSWINGQRMLERSLPTAAPLMVLHRRRLGLHHDGYLLMDKIEDAVDLHTFVQRLGELAPRERRRVLLAYIEEVARLIRKLHVCRMSHRDLKASNILVSDPRTELAVPHCWLIDLVGVTQLNRLGNARKLQNLARLNASFCYCPDISRTDRLRFLLQYMQAGLSGRETWRTWWKQLDQATQAKVARNLRQQRVLG